MAIRDIALYQLRLYLTNRYRNTKINYITIFKHDYAKAMVSSFEDDTF